MTGRRRGGYDAGGADDAAVATPGNTYMQTLSGIDGVFLHLETPMLPMHVGSLSLLEPPDGHRGSFLGRVHRLYERRLPLAPVLSRRLQEFPLNMANPVWVQADKVVVEDHVRQVRLPSPGTRAQLEACVAELHSQTLDRSRPLWSAWVIEGLRDGRIGYYTNIHHAVVDGQSGVELMRAIFDTTPRARRRVPKARHRTHEEPSARAVMASTLRHDLTQYLELVRTLPTLARKLARSAAGASTDPSGVASLGVGPRTPFNVALDARRGFATASIPLAAAHRLAAQHEATLNDVVLASCAGALRSYLGRRGGVPAEPLVAGMPVSLRTPGKVEFTTQATMRRIGLATQYADPLRRLRAIRDSTRLAKAAVARGDDFVPVDFPTLGVPWLLHGLATLYGRPAVANRIPPVANLVVSNVPGPPQPLYFAGAKMLHHWPLSIVGHGLGLNITVESYAGQLEFGVTTGLTAVAQPRAIADGLLAAFTQLQRRSRGRSRKP